MRQFGIISKCWRLKKKIREKHCHTLAVVFWETEKRSIGWRLRRLLESLERQSSRTTKQQQQFAMKFVNNNNK